MDQWLEDLPVKTTTELRPVSIPGRGHSGWKVHCLGTEKSQLSLVEKR